MRTIDILEATEPLSKYAKEVAKEPVILTIGGKPVAALIHIENADWETVTLSSHPAFLALIEKSRARLKSDGGLSSSEVRRKLGMKRTL